MMPPLWMQLNLLRHDHKMFNGVIKSSKRRFKPWIKRHRLHQSKLRNSQHLESAHMQNFVMHSPVREIAIGWGVETSSPRVSLNF